MITEEGGNEKGEMNGLMKGKNARKSKKRVEEKKLVECRTEQERKGNNFFFFFLGGE